jgi:hypothetical protein
MNRNTTKSNSGWLLQWRETSECNSATAHSELLLLPDGRILVHNLTPAFADLLRQLNPDDDQIQPRSGQIAHRESRVAQPTP